MKFETVNLNDFVFPRNSGEVGKISSRVIATYFGKRHDNVLRDIQTLDSDRTFNALNFEAVKYTDAKGEERLEILMTREGCMFLIMGYTGKKAAKIKQELVLKFVAMEKRIAQLEKRWLNAQLRRQTRLQADLIESDRLDEAVNNPEGIRRPLDELRSKFGVEG